MPAETEPLALQLPAPTLKGTPEDLPAGANIEPYSDKAPTPLQVPKGVKNVAADKPVTSSVKPFTGELTQLTDGKKEAFDYDSVEMKKGALENKNDIKRRIEEAAKFVPVEQLALSPQCGFASNAEGNALTVDQEKAKLQLIVEIATEVWGRV